MHCQDTSSPSYLSKECLVQKPSTFVSEETHSIRRFSVEEEFRTDVNGEVLASNWKEPHRRIISINTL